eukprot:SAG31_NODE_1062_length_10105_cov_11.143814_1_plen_149_part_00
MSVGRFGTRLLILIRLLFGIFAGYALTQVLGGWAAQRFGGKYVIAAAVLCYSLATLLTPPAAHLGVGPLVLCRVMLGVGEGFSLPALHHITSNWAPDTERSRFVMLAVSGQYLGTAATLLCGPLVALYWPSIFLLFGATCRCQPSSFC